MDIIRLSDIDKGQSARIVRVETREDIKRRLTGLGLSEGADVRCLVISGRGSIRAYCLRGSVIALRREDTDRIFVRGVTDEHS